MNEKEKKQGPIINSLHRDLKPVDYSFIEELTKNAGVTSEYLKECEEIHRKKSLENQRAKK